MGSKSGFKSNEKKHPGLNDSATFASHVLCIERPHIGSANHSQELSGWMLI